MELCELVYDEPLRLLHTLSSDSVRYRERLGDKLPTADTWEKENNLSWDRHNNAHVGAGWPQKHLPCALPFRSTQGLHEWAAGWVRREHHGAVSGINYSLWSQENGDGLNTAGVCLAGWVKRRTELVEVVTEVTALTQPMITELNVRNYRKQWANLRKDKSDTRTNTKLQYVAMWYISQYVVIVTWM